MKLKVLAIIILVLIITFSLSDKEELGDQITNFVNWVNSLGPIAPIALAIVHSIAIVVCFPGTIAFEWAAGFLFGLIGGSILVLITKTAGASICFFLGRTVFIDWVKEKIAQSKNQTFKNVFENIGREGGFKFAFLLRLSPVPSWMNNYGLSLTPISYPAFFVSNFGSLPMILQNVYVGTFFQSATSISFKQAKSTGISDTWKTIMFLVGLVSTALITRMLYSYATSSLEHRKENDRSKV